MFNKLLFLSILLFFFSCKKEKQNISNKDENVKKVNRFINIKPDFVVKYDSIDSNHDFFNVEDTKLLRVQGHTDKIDKYKTPLISNKSKFTIEFYFIIDENNYNLNNTILNLLDFNKSKGRYGQTLLSLWFSKRRISGFQNGVDLRKHGEVIDRKGFSEEFLTSKELESNRLYKLTYSYKPGTVKIYIDDVIYAIYKDIKPSSRNAKEMIVGQCWSNGKPINPFYGGISEVKFYLNKF